MSAQPLKISVVTAVRNNRATVMDCVRSVAAQSWPNVEHVVIDGLSSDGTLELLEASRSSIDVLVSEHDNGIYNALNKGIARCTGDVIGFLHADDFFADDEVLARVARAFDEPAVDVVYGDLMYVSKADPARDIRYWRSGSFSPQELARGWMPPHPTLYVRSEVYRKMGGFDENYRIAADYDHVLRIFGRPHVRAAYIPEVLVKMRTGGVSNASLRNILRKSAEDYRALRKNGIGGLSTLLSKNVRKLHQFHTRPS